MQQSLSKSVESEHTVDVSQFLSRREEMSWDLFNLRIFGGSSSFCELGLEFGALEILKNILACTARVSEQPYLPEGL